LKSKKLYSPAANRNKEALFKILQEQISSKAHILEIASGTGQHADYFSTQMPKWSWQASDTSREALESIKNYQRDSKRSNFLNPIELSTLDEKWNLPKFDATLCCNMIHISPWESCLGLFKHLKLYLKNHGKLILYGPFFREEIETAPSNLEFDQSLKERNSLWGIRSLSEVEKVATQEEFKLIQFYEMPANNLTVIFELYNS